MGMGWYSIHHKPNNRHFKFHGLLNHQIKVLAKFVCITCCSCNSSCWIKNPCWRRNANYL